MQQLHMVGFTTDHRGLIFSVRRGAKSGGFVVKLDDSVMTLLAHLEFPIWFWDVLFYDKGGALIVLVVRDVLTLAAGLLALWAWRARSLRNETTATAVA